MINVDSFAEEIYLQRQCDTGHCEAAHRAIVVPS